MEESPEAFELQQSLQRFTTQFVERVTYASEGLEASLRQEVRDEALRKHLLYASSAVEIATGPAPEVNLLDMMVFARLCRTALERWWIPELYGDEGLALADAFLRFEGDLDGLAAKALTQAQRELLAAAIAAWLAENPSRRRVEGIRLDDFAGLATAPSSPARGLLSSVRMAKRVANHALLLSERGLFLVHRLPFLWRLQARLGAREVVGDVMTQLFNGPHSPFAGVRRLARHVTRLLPRSSRSPRAVPAP